MFILLRVIRKWIEQGIRECAGLWGHLADAGSRQGLCRRGDFPNTRRGQGYAPSIFTSVGIDPERKHILVVKSTQHFHAAFAPISKQVLYSGDLGALPGDMTLVPYRRADVGRLWPLVEDPFAS